MLYVIALRRSEANRLTGEQFNNEGKEIKLEAIQLSEAERQNKKTGKVMARKDLYRKEAFIPLKGNRGMFGLLVQDYLSRLQPKEKLFKFTSKSSRPYQIVTCYTKGLAKKER